LELIMANNAGKGEKQSKLQAEQDRRDSAQAKYDAKVKAEGPVENGWFSGKRSTPAAPAKPSAPGRKAAPRDKGGSSSSYFSQPFNKPNTPTKPAAPASYFADISTPKSVKPAKPAPAGVSTKFAKNTPGSAVQDFTDLGINRVADTRMLAASDTAMAFGPARDKVVTRSITPAVAQTKVVSTPVRTAKATPARQVPMPPQRPAGIPPSYPTGNAAMAFGPAREKVSTPFSSVSVKGGNGMGGNSGGGSAARSDSRDTAMSFGPGRTPSRAFDK
jgi:hypothetical protein